MDPISLAVNELFLSLSVYDTTTVDGRRPIGHCPTPIRPARSPDLMPLSILTRSPRLTCHVDPEPRNRYFSRVFHAFLMHIRPRDIAM